MVKKRYILSITEFTLLSLKIKIEGNYSLLIKEKEKEIKMVFKYEGVKVLKHMTKNNQVHN